LQEKSSHNGKYSLDKVRETDYNVRINDKQHGRIYKKTAAALIRMERR
jgi:hypothetical protein